MHRIAQSCCGPLRAGIRADPVSVARRLAFAATLMVRLAAISAAAIAPVSAATLHATGPSADSRTLLYRANVFSDDPNSLHDPRHPQPQTGADRMFAPIGLVWTNQPQPDQGAAPTSHLHMGTAFLVSPCYVLTAYHIVFGYRAGARKGQAQPEREVSATFGAGGRTARAVPVKWGRFSMFPGQDWALLRLQPGRGDRCLGADPEIGWVRLAPLTPSTAAKKPLSVAGYPADKNRALLWRQDTCHLFERYRDAANDGLWKTDCATRPRSSGAPIFFVENGVLNVVALMSGHLGNDADDKILPRWDPNRANLALDIGKIIASEPDVPKLIKADIDRFRRPNPARVR